MKLNDYQKGRLSGTVFMFGILFLLAGQHFNNLYLSLLGCCFYAIDAIYNIQRSGK